MNSHVPIFLPATIIVFSPSLYHSVGLCRFSVYYPRESAFITPLLMKCVFERSLLLASCHVSVVSTHV